MYAFDTDSTSTIELQDEGNRVLLSIGALLHIYPRKFQMNNFTLALSPGISTSNGFDNINYHLGLSGIVGKKNRIVFTLGFTFRESLVFDDKSNLNRGITPFALNTSYSNEVLPEIPPVRKDFRSGLFFGLSYNLSSSNN